MAEAWNKGKPFSEETRAKMSRSHLGKHLSEESKRKLSEFNKGKTLSNEHKEKIGAAQKGRKFSEEHNQRIKDGLAKFYINFTDEEKRARFASLGAKGKGTKRSEETKRAISQSLKGKPFTEEHRQNIVKARREKPLSPEAREAIADKLRGRKLTEDHKRKIREHAFRGPMPPEFGKKISASKMGHLVSESTRLKLSKTKKERWLEMSPEKKEKVIEDLAVGRHTSASNSKPTSIERIVSDVLDNLNIKYQGQKRIGVYCADFFIPSLLLVVECDGEYWHNKPGVPERDKVRDEYMNNLGISVLRLKEKDIHSNVEFFFIKGLNQILSSRYLSLIQETTTITQMVD